MTREQIVQFMLDHESELLEAYEKIYERNRDTAFKEELKRQPIITYYIDENEVPTRASGGNGGNSG